MPKFETVKIDDDYGIEVGVPVIPNLSQRILEQVQEDPDRFDMSSWHGRETYPAPAADCKYKCDTTHCVAGWAVVVAGDQGRELEVALGGDTEAAADLLFEHSLLGNIFPSFYGTNEEALADLKNFAAREADVLASMALDGK